MQGPPYIGKAGQMLNRMIDSINFKRVIFVGDKGATIMSIEKPASPIKGHHFEIPDTPMCIDVEMDKVINNASETVLDICDNLITRRGDNSVIVITIHCAGASVLVRVLEDTDD